MNYRETDLYKTMTSYLACAYAEGFCEGEGATEEQQLIAWQYISDHGLRRNLQGFYGRTVDTLLRHNMIQPPKEN